MPRQIQFAGSSDHCTLLLARLHDHPGIARIMLQPGASKVPEGDVLMIEAANQASTEILNMLNNFDLLHGGVVSITEPNATIPAKASRTIDEEDNDAVWEETGTMMRQDTNPAFNYSALMALSGAVAAFGIGSSRCDQGRRADHRRHGEPRAAALLNACCRRCIGDRPPIGVRRHLRRQPPTYRSPRASK